ncbi:hypothetical protein [Allorhizobium sonneratiae]|uniref:hypothetical protein n=1 Tax=Allorhizobium sonneratiae TaxID=2934936 RepID=UPI003B84B4A0
MRTGRSLPGGFLAHSSRFSGENGARNLALAEALGRVAVTRGISTAQAAIAWVLAQGKDIVPAIEQAIPKGSASGSRYAEAQMAHLDSEK